MKLLLDINVLLDVLLQRDPWAESAASLLTRIERGEANGFVAGHTLTTIHYVVSRARDRQLAAAAVSDLLRFLEVVPIEKVDFTQALVLPIVIHLFADRLVQCATSRRTVHQHEPRPQARYKPTPLHAVRQR